MKEIDFLPRWYKAGRKRRVNYRRQYIIIAGIVVTMLTWSFAASYSISTVKGQVQMMQNSIDSHRNIAMQYQDFQEELSDLSKKASLLKKLEPDISISSILAELSWLIDENVVLTRVTIDTEPYDDSPQKKMKRSALTIARNSQNKNVSVMPAENTRLKLIIMGIAKGTSDVAQMILNLEKSEYFTQVIPGFSRNSQMPSKISSTEFEITCFVANYTVKKD